MKITGMQYKEVEVEIDDRQLAYALMQVVLRKLGLSLSFDDAGCQWMTNWYGGIFIGSSDWQVGDNVETSYLVDAANILACGHVVRVDYSKERNNERQAND
jgi:hypothetical protein